MIRRLRCVTLGAMLSVVVMASGCASGGAQMAVKTTTSMDQTIDALAAGKAQIDTAVAAMNALVSDPDQELRPPFDRLKREIANLEKAADRVRNRRQTMEKQRTAYINAWEKQAADIDNQVIQERVRQRRELTVQRFESIAAAMVAAREAYDPFIETLRDIRDYLDFDLNPSGVAGCKDLAASATAMADDVKAQIDLVDRQLRAVREAMRQSGSTMTESPESDASEDMDG